MTQEQIAKYEQAARDGSLPEEENPLFLFGATSTSLLVRALNKEFDITMLIRLQLATRGVDEKGRWVGFEKAKQTLKIAPAKKAAVKKDDKPGNNKL